MSENNNNEEKGSIQKQEPKVQNENIKKKSIKDKKLIRKISEFERNTNLSIYIGTGIYQIIIGLLIAWFVSFLIGLPIIMAYPYIHPILLWILKIFAWVLVSFGIITILIPIIKSKVNRESNLLKYLDKFLKINKYVVLILIPIGTFLALALNSEIQKSKGTYQEEKSVARLYFLLLFLAGFIHTIMGIVLIFILPSIISGYYDLLFPYLNMELLNFLTILGWVSFIPGIILILCSGFSKKLGSIEDITREGKFIKIMVIAIIGASVFITMVFPIGTFFGLTLIQEFYPLSKTKSE